MLTHLFGVMQTLWLRRAALADERGASTAELVIITAALAAVAIAVTVIIANLITNKAATIDLG